MTEIKKYLKPLVEDAGIALDDGAYDKLCVYAGMLAEKNKVMNLTAITDTEGIAVKHFYDSLLPLKYIDLPDGAEVIDVGTGAGFPGLVLKIARPGIRLTLLDSLRKRLDFLSEVCGELSIDARTVHARAEDAGRGELRECFDFAFARAVAELPVLAEYCLPFVRVGGVFAALKGRKAAEESEKAKRAITELSGRIEGLYEEQLPTDSGERGIIIIKKISQISPKYPRVSAKISKFPLA